MELGYGVVDGVGGHMECLRDGICPELPDGGMPSESEKVVEKGVPLQHLSWMESYLAQEAEEVRTEARKETSSSSIEHQGI